MIDLVASVVCLAAGVAVLVGYRRRAARQGAYQSDRAASEGSSVLLASWVMAAVHWALAPVGRASVRAGITADGVTAASLVLGGLAGVAIASGHWGLGAALAAISALGDTLDGIIARTTGTASDEGELFDAAVDRYTEFFFLGGATFALRDRPVLMALSLAALLGSFMVSYSTAKAEALHVTPPRGPMRRSERATYLVGAALLSPLVGAWWPGQAIVPVAIAIALVAVAANISAVRRLLAITTLVQRARVSAH